MASFKCLPVVFVCLLLASVLNAQGGRRIRKCRVDDEGVCSEVMGLRGALRGVGLCGLEGGACRQVQGARGGWKCECTKVDEASVIVLF